MRFFKNIIDRMMNYIGYKIIKSSSLDEIIFNYESQLSSIKQNIDEYQSLITNSVVISDYKYDSIIRDSFPLSKIGRIINEDFILNKNTYKNLVDKIKKFAPALQTIPLRGSDTSITPYWLNNWIPPIDGAMIYTTLALKNPRYYVECGSGNTTKFAAKAISDNALRTKIISIDPCPRAEIDQVCDEIYRCPFEKMDLSFFTRLSDEDIFIIDNSHRVLPNSDVTVFFTEVLPELPSGIIYALHDIALPNEIYTDRYYTEQYMLATYILGGMNDDKIYFPTGFLSTNTTLLHDLTHELHIHDLPFYNGGGFFWMLRG